MHNLNKKSNAQIFFFYNQYEFFFFIIEIKNSKIGNIIKLMNVKLQGAKPSTVIAPRKNGAMNTINILLSNKFLKLSLKSFFQFYAF